MEVFVYGGSGSGKSAWAEQLAQQLAGENRGGSLVYLATMEPWGGEADRRIARHQEQRAGQGFATLEQPTALDRLRLPEDCTLLLECLGTWVANEIFSPRGAGADTLEAVERGLASLARQARHLIVVGNDLGADGIHYPSGTQGYQLLLGDISRRQAARSQLVTEVVCGIPILLKGVLP